jgi:adenylylsulfate kinase
MRTCHPGLTLWLTGLSGSGKSTLANSVCEQLRVLGCRAEVLDGEILRQELWKDLDFSKSGRDENIRRIGFLAELLTRNDVIVLVAAISPYRAVRDEVRAKIGSFAEIYVNASAEVCERRDTKGLYKRARRGELKGLTAIDDPYEAPEQPEIVCKTDSETVEDSASRIVTYVKKRLQIKPATDPEV